MTEAERLAGIRRARTRRDRGDRASREAREDITRMVLEGVDAGDSRTALAEAAGLTRQGVHWIIDERRRVNAP